MLMEHVDCTIINTTRKQKNLELITTFRETLSINNIKQENNSIRNEGIEVNVLVHVGIGSMLSMINRWTK